MFLDDLNITLKPSNHDSLYKAGEAWKEYLKRRGPENQCPACGNKMTINCNECGQPLKTRHMISDFIIGAQSKVPANTSITRDRGIYKTYFKDLTINFGDLSPTT